MIIIVLMQVKIHRHLARLFFSVAPEGSLRTLIGRQTQLALAEIDYAIWSGRVYLQTAAGCLRKCLYSGWNQARTNTHAHKAQS